MISEDVFKYHLLPFVDIDGLYRLTLSGIPGASSELIERLSKIPLAQLMSLYLDYKREPFSTILTDRLSALDRTEAIWLISEYDEPDTLAMYPLAYDEEIQLLYNCVAISSLRLGTYIAEKLGLEILSQCPTGKGAVLLSSPRLIKGLDKYPFLIGEFLASLYREGRFNGMKKLVSRVREVPIEALENLSVFLDLWEKKIWYSALSGQKIVTTDYGDPLRELLIFYDYVKSFGTIVGRVNTDPKRYP
jgi:hypothetical protein